MYEPITNYPYSRGISARPHKKVQLSEDIYNKARGCRILLDPFHFSDVLKKVHNL